MNDLQKTIHALNKKGFHAELVPDAAAARDAVLALIDKDDTIGIGGSMTLEETGIFAAVTALGQTVYSTRVAAARGEDPLQARKDGMGADVYLTSTNALTTAGDLINIDGFGNRVAAMFYGPQKVIVVAGKNKIASNPHTAVARIKKVACPLNARRLHLNTPCAATGVCTECDVPNRMCNVTVRIQYPTYGKDIYVILIDDDFGY
jgi:hypothetical protein